MRRILLTIAALIILVIITGRAFATANTQTICHCEETPGQCQSLTIGTKAAGKHLEEHEADYAGACVAPTPTITPTVKPSCSPTPSPTVEPEVTITVTPTVVEATPTASPATPEQKVDVSDGKSDGRSDGSCSQPPCITNLSGQPLLPLNNVGK